MRDDSAQEAPLSRATAVVRPLGAATRRAGLPALAERLEALRRWLGSDLAALERDLAAIEGLDHDCARRAAAHLLEQPGKRIRPICVLLGVRLGHGPVDAHARDLAVACELVHAATLLHDDVIDEAAVRRGAPAARIVYGNSASILGGDFLLVEALERVQRAGDPRLLATLLSCIADMVGAEALQLERRGRFEPDRDAYLTIVDGKTASLFRWALASGARAGGLPEPAIAALGRAGMALGRAFQLVDDALDLAGDPLVTGKDLLADLAQGKLTWPLLVASERDGSIAGRLREAAATALTPGEAAALADDVRATGAVDATRALADEERRAAARELATLPPSRARHALELVTEAAVARSA